ncbi:MAG: M3 family metallopeptidase [Candidatus Cybelea sp.]
MKALASSLAAGVLFAAVPAPGYQIDLARYFPSATIELRSRATAIAGAQAFAESPTPVSAPALLHWLQRCDTLLRSLERHDIYVYIKSEQDDRDVADAKADEALGDAEDLVTGRVVEAARELGAARIAALTGAPSLAPYRYLLTDSLARAAHRLDPAEAKSVAAAVTPTLDAAAASYKTLRKSSASIERNQNAYAALLVSIASARNGLARLRGFATAAQAAYFDRSIDPALVDRTLRAVRESGAYARYLVVAAKARKPGFAPPNLPISDALALILAAERRVNGEYADAYAKLLDPAERRLEICTAPNCDDTGFSVGFAGAESGVYYGGYDGAMRSVRAIAHESGHAVHREFMNLNQPIAAYNRGPAFMFESFAIFNELLFLDHLYQSAATREARAYYLNDFLKDAAFQVFGSAEETELESSIYRGVDDRTITTAADLNALSKQVFAHYDAAAASDPATELYWARDRLFFTDPLYDVNYLYAGLLAERYFSDFERDPGGFSPRYVALLKNGFDDSPAALERRFLGIDLSDERALVENSALLIDARTALLAKLYSNGE